MHRKQEGKGRRKRRGGTEKRCRKRGQEEQEGGGMNGEDAKERVNFAEICDKKR
jgi:hypothetical protein